MPHCNNLYLFIVSEDKDDNLANEDPTPYKKEKSLSELFPGIHLSSLPEQDRLSAEYSMSLSPVERMALMHQLILIAYAEELKKPVEELWNKTITVEKLKW
jgi:hypothetical protein